MYVSEIVVRELKSCFPVAFQENRKNLSIPEIALQNTLKTGPLLETRLLV